MYFRFYISIALLIVITIFFPFSLFKEAQTIDWNVNLMLSYLVILISGIKLSFLSYKNQQRLLELTFWLFTYIWMGLTPFGHILLKIYAWPGIYSDQEITTALIFVILGLISYEIGIFWGKSRFSKKEVSNLEKFTPKNITKQWIYLVSFISIILAFFLVSKTGGFHSLFSSRLDRAADVGTVLSKSTGLLYDNLQKVPIFVALIICLTLRKNQKQKKLFFLTIILLFVNLIISNPISNARYWFGSVAISLGFVLFKWRRNSFGLWVFSLIMLLLVIFPYSDLFRVSTSSSVQVKSLSYQLLQKGDYDAFQQLLNTIQYVDMNGIVYGKQLIGAIFFWVPRSIWVSKPVGTGQMVAESLGYRFTNFSCPLWAESYINFGIIGIVVIFIFYGYISYYLQNRFINSRKDLSMIQLFVPFFAAYQLFLLRGDLLNGMAYMSAYILFAYLFTRFAPKKTYRFTLN